MGILIQNSLQNQLIQSAVVGIGINVNSGNFEQLPHATSIIENSRLDTNLDFLLSTLFVSLEQRYLALKAKHFDNLVHEYYQVMYGYQENCAFKTAKGKRFEGTIIEVSSDGKLVVQIGEATQSFNVKEISFLL